MLSKDKLERPITCCDSPGGYRRAFGPAVNESYYLQKGGHVSRDSNESDEQSVTGEMYVSNGEYESQVNFCPFCGRKADVQIQES